MLWSRYTSLLSTTLARRISTIAAIIAWPTKRCGILNQHFRLHGQRWPVVASSICGTFQTCRILAVVTTPSLPSHSTAVKFKKMLATAGQTSLIFSSLRHVEYSSVFRHLLCYAKHIWHSLTLQLLSSLLSNSTTFHPSSNSMEDVSGMRRRKKFPASALASFFPRQRRQ